MGNDYRSSIVNGQVVYYRKEGKPSRPDRPKVDKSGKPVQITGGAYTEVQIQEEQNKKDKLKNYSIIKTSEISGKKIADLKLLKFVNLKV